MLRHWFVLLLTLALVVVAGVAIKRGLDNAKPVERRQAGPVPVVVELPVMREFVDRIEALGTARANESVRLTAKVSEIVRRVNFSDGDLAAKGDVLVELTNDAENAQLAEYRASLAEAKKQFARISGLVKRGNAAQSVLDQQKAAVQTAEARIDGTLARLSDRLIRAPFSGILGFRQVSPGTLVTPNTVIATLDDIHLIKLDFAVPEIFLATLTEGLDVLAVSPAYPGVAFRGRVTTVNSRVDPVTRAVTARAEIKNDDSRLRPGMLLTVTVSRSRGLALTVPEEALVPVQDRQYVYVVTAGNKAERRQITIGERRPGYVEVTDGLGPSDKVVIEGTLRLRPGAAVRIVRIANQESAVGGDALGSE